ncbi:MAG: hypothetical protein KAW13_06945, partial [Dehalococcoidia bacterium]|nr:hypothetical protein [Dehalococcoidia bacterium]
FQTGQGTSWEFLGWDKTLPPGTNVTFEVRASSTPFNRIDSTPALRDASAISIAGSVVNGWQL